MATKGIGGELLRWNHEKKFGFIKPFVPGHEDGVFVHRREITNGPLNIGDEVVLDLVEGRHQGKLECANVRLVQSHTFQKGRVVKWFDDKCFGFVELEASGLNAFLHIKYLNECAPYVGSEVWVKVKQNQRRLDKFEVFEADMGYDSYEGGPPPPRYMERERDYYPPPHREEFGFGGPPRGPPRGGPPRCPPRDRRSPPSDPNQYNPIHDSGNSQFNAPKHASGPYASKPRGQAQNPYNSEAPTQNQYGKPPQNPYRSKPYGSERSQNRYDASANPYGSKPAPKHQVSGNQNLYSQPTPAGNNYGRANASQNPYGAPASSQSKASGYGPPKHQVSGNQNLYSQPAPAGNQYGQANSSQNSYGGPASSEPKASGYGFSQPSRSGNGFGASNPYMQQKPPTQLASQSPAITQRYSSF